MNSKTRKSVLLGFIMVLALPLALYAQGGEKAEAQTLFKQSCAMCHGADARAQTPMGKSLKIPDLHSAAVQQKTDAELTTIISDGKGKMPPYKAKLKPEQIKDLVTYIKSLGKEGKTGGEAMKKQ